jgi:NTE family protein
MVKKLFIFFVFSVLYPNFLYSQKVGLVLSGGGAKGAVHIGIIKALEENDIPIDCISGTSIGAIVGSLYAMGYAPEEMLNLFLSDDFHYWQTGKVEKDFQFYFWQRDDNPSFVHINIPLKNSIEDIRGSILPNSLVNPVQMNQAFLQLYSQAEAQCDGNFDDLFVPFLCLASDIYNKKPVVFRNGSLGDAVRASMSFPLFFKPIIKDDLPLWDGGIYDNFPIHPMKQAWHPDIIIGSSLANQNPKKPADQNLYNQLENMIMQKTEYNIDSEDGILMKFNIEDVNLLDFNKAKSLYDLGYAKTIEMIDSIKGRIERRVALSEINARRTEYKASLPPLIFKNIYISGVSESQKTYIEGQIYRNNTEAFTILDFKKTYFRLLTNSKIKEILPHAEYDSENRTFDLFLDIKMSDELKVDFGGNISSRSANQIYLGLGYQSLTELSTYLNMDMQWGNAYNGIALLGKLEMIAGIPLDLSALASYNTRKFYESEKLFIDTDLGTFSSQQEAFGRIGLGLPFLMNAKMELGFGYGGLEDKYYQSNNYKDAFDRSRYNLFNFGLYYQKNSLDAKQFPVSGHKHQIYAQYISGKETFIPSNRQKEAVHQSYIQLSTTFNDYHTINSKFNLGYRVETVISSKNLWSNYTSSVLQAPGFTPTLHSMLTFNEAFHANQYLAGGVIPIMKLNSTFHLRGDFYGFFPLYPILKGENNRARYGDLFAAPAYMGELNFVAQLPFVSVSMYVNHYSYPKSNWNFGLNIGYLIFGPKFIP